MISKGNHVKFVRFVLLAVGEEAKTWLPGLLRWPSKTEKIVEDRTHKTQKGRRRWQRSCLRGIFTSLEIKYQFHLLSWPFFFVQCITKQLLDLVFVISRIIKVSVRVIGLSLLHWLITPSLTLIILDITKTSSNNCLKSWSVNVFPFTLYKITRITFSGMIRTSSSIWSRWRLSARSGGGSRLVAGGSRLSAISDGRRSSSWSKKGSNTGNFSL